MEEKNTKPPGGLIISSRCDLSPPDMDECSFSEFLCQHECVNQPGTYFCSCPPGYILLDDNRSCQGKAVQGELAGERVRCGLAQGVIWMSSPGEGGRDEGRSGFQRLPEGQALALMFGLPVL